jgi:dTDP-4-amino-4,6-dideoxygalactose transaminase
MKSLRPWRERYLVFGHPFIGQEEREEILACIDSRWLGSGPRVQRLEEDFRKYIGAPTAVALNSCTAALHLTLRELRLGPGAEAITTAMTFCATANAIVHAGLKPVFADCDRHTMNIDPADIERKITKNTRALVPVHFAGRPCDMEAIMDIARRHSLRVVEDCAHAIESTYNGQHCGTFGDFGCFSFYVTKNMTTGEGGMVVSRDAESASRIKVAALHGMSKDAWRRFSDKGYVHYETLEPGFKYNLTDLAASFGIHQLARIEKMLVVRQRLWDFYQKELAGLPLILPAAAPKHMRHSLHLFICLIDDTRTRVTRDEVLQGMHELRIGCGVHYTALHLHRYYRETYGYREGDLPNTEYIGARTFSIPLSAAVTDEDAADVVKALKMILE